MTMRNRIALIPHPYDIRWAREFNELLRRNMFLAYPYRHARYMESRSLHHLWLAKALPVLRKEGITSAFFVNAEDYSLDVLRTTSISRIFAFVHGLPNALDPGISKETIERAMLGEFDRLFVASEFTASQIDRPTEVIGAPVFRPMIVPDPQATGMIWAHRISKEKSPLSLLELPDDLRERTTICYPTFQTNMLGALKSAFKNVLHNPPDLDAIYRRAAYTLSFATYDPFGWATIDGLFLGSFVLAMDNPNTDYRELYPPEMLFKTVGECVDKIRYYDAHPDERCALVTQAQAKVEHLSYPRWVKTLMGKLDE